MKKILFLLIPTVAFAQPKSIHYSSVGDYLVDQNGNKTTITGHPTMTCYMPWITLTGKLQKVRGKTLWLICPDGKKSFYVEVKNPVCDLK